MDEFINIYHKLKENDPENRVSLFDKVISLKVTENYEIKVYDNNKEAYVEFVCNGRQLTHDHPDFEEAYDYLSEVLNNIENLPTEDKLIHKFLINLGEDEEVSRKEKLKISDIILFLLVILLLIFLILSSYVVGIVILIPILIFIVIKKLRVKRTK